MATFNKDEKIWQQEPGCNAQIHVRSNHQSCCRYSSYDMPAFRQAVVRIDASLIDIFQKGIRKSNFG